MRLLLYPHGGSGNHGCEAIVRSTAGITNANLVLCSSKVSEDQYYGLDDVCKLVEDRKPISYWSLCYLKAFLEYRLGNKDAYDIAYFRTIFDESNKVDIALSIGGDNYCYGIPQHLYLVNSVLRKKGVSTVLWGCSIEPSSIKGAMLEDLKGFRHIFARESITYHALKDAGVNAVSLCPDPAFVLPAIEHELPEGFVPKNTVGINVSPMIIANETVNGITIDNYILLMRYIIDRTDMNIALIPHVVWEFNDDRQPLKKLYDLFAHTGRVVMIKDVGAQHLKYVISKCRYLIAARTHASVAAYSSQVPTLVVGYSVKAKGIAKDIFGVYEKYVVPVQALKNRGELLEAFQWLEKQEEKIHLLYANKMPSYIDSAKNAGDLLKCL